MLTQEQINAAVSDALPDVLAGLRKEISEQALYYAKNAVQVAVQKAVTDWMTDEVVPEIKKALVESKEGLIAAAPAMATGMNAMLVETMLAHLKEKLEQTWKRQEILKALFN